MIVGIAREDSASEHLERKEREMQDRAAEMRAWPLWAMTPHPCNLIHLRRIYSTHSPLHTNR